MLGFDELRPTLELDGAYMRCPVRDCATLVPVQIGKFVAHNRYRCPEHRICIGKSTFEYSDEHANLLWTAPPDRALLTQIKAFKREDRMKRERSEDALTWNVFRHLQTSGRLADWLVTLSGAAATAPEVHYWSFDATTGTTWAPLAQAREAFGERANRGSEPDLVITTEEAHIWVEAKFGSTNNTRPSDAAGAENRYTVGGGRWYEQTVNSTFQEVAVRQRRYELLRLWLLGSWAAARHGKRFELVNVVRQGLEEDVPSFAAANFKLTPARRVHRVTWESLDAFISSTPTRAIDDDKLRRYLKDKTLGYSSAGRLVRAFALE